MSKHNYQSGAERAALVGNDEFNAVPWDYLDGGTEWREDRQPPPVTLAPFPWADKPLPPEETGH